MTSLSWPSALGERIILVLARLRRRTPAPAPPPAVERHPWEASYPDELRWRVDIPAKPLPALLDEAVARYPDRTCVEFLGKSTSYREIGRLVDCAARGFQELGVGKGVSVGLFLPNTPYFVICYYAVLKAGGTVVSINPLYAEEEVLRLLRETAARIVVTVDAAALYPKLAAIADAAALEKIVVCRMADALPFPHGPLFRLLKRREIATIARDARHLDFRALIANSGGCRPVEIDPHRDVAVLQPTGGTTGLPKAAMLTHANLYANTVQTAMWFPGMEQGGERILGVLPLAHVFAMTVVMSCGIHGGATLILLPRFRLAMVLQAIHKKRPTLIPGVPTMFAAIAGSEQVKRLDLTSVKYCLSGGAPLPLRVKRDFEALTGCRLVEGYGLTECAPVVAVSPFRGGKDGSVGLPLPATVVEITTLGEPRRVLAPGEIGEITVRGPQVMAGYWRRPEETASTIIDGRLHTGDVGTIDADGYLFITDRIKDLILVGGFNVFPRMVEDAILRHPAVADVAVCGIPDDYRGEMVKAFIVRRPGETLTPAALREFLRDKLAPFEIPRSITFRDSLPRTPIGKLLRRELVAAEVARRQARTRELA
jgi:long-chain acyl-CoA synthetase